MMRDELAALLNQAIPDGRANVMVHCPLHEDRRPSLSLSLEKGVWYCHSCGKGGGVRRLAQMLGGDLDAADLAVRTLKLSPDDPEPDFRLIWAKHWYAAVSDEGQAALQAYSDSKQLSDEVAFHFGIGYDTVRKALSMPYFDGNAVRSIQYRYADGSKNQEPGGKRILYNVDEARGASRVIVCEGESDTHRVWSGFTEEDDVAVIGVPGAASGNRRWELWSLDLLWAERVVIAFDADEAGDKGAEVAMRALGDKAVRVRPEGGKDWCDAGVANWDELDAALEG